MRAPLSPREVEVLRLVSQGRTSKEIAATLGIALSTVNWHIANALEKLGASSRAEAVALALGGLSSEPAVAPRARDMRARLASAVLIASAVAIALVASVAVAQLRLDRPARPEPASTPAPTGTLAPTPADTLAPTPAPGELAPGTPPARPRGEGGPPTVAPAGSAIVAPTLVPTPDAPALAAPPIGAPALLEATPSLPAVTLPTAPLPSATPAVPRLR